MKFPKVHVNRQNAERLLIACSAALVLALSLNSGRMNRELYEEPLDQIPQENTVVSTGAIQEETQETVVYYQDGDGYLVPVQRDIARQNGIAKATLSLMVASPRNDMEAARLGLTPVFPEGTTFDIDISGGHARVDMSSEVLNADSREQEVNLRTAAVWALTEFDTVTDVDFLVGGQKRETLTHGTDIAGYYTRTGLNRETESVATFAGGNETLMYFPAQDNRLLVPVSRMVYGEDDVATAVFEFLRGPKTDSGLETPLPEDVKLLGVSLRDGVVTIEFSSEFTKIAEQHDGGVMAMRALMLTCLRYPGVKRVKILVDGQPYDMPKESAPTFANIASEVENSYPEVLTIE